MGPAGLDSIWRCANWNRNLRLGAPGASQPPLRDSPLLCAAHRKARPTHPESDRNMLQAVHKNQRAAQASSLYCVWTTRDGNLGSPLVAVWIDSSMGAFESDCSSKAAADTVEMGQTNPGSYAVICAGRRPSRQAREKLSTMKSWTRFPKKPRFMCRVFGA